MRPCLVTRTLCRPARGDQRLAALSPASQATLAHKPPRETASQATPQPSHKTTHNHPTKPPHKPHNNRPTKTPHTTPRNHPTKPLRGFARTPDRGAISRDAGSRPRFAGTPFSSGVALPQLLVVRRSKRPTAARYEQGWWDTT
jgi:hypothetical protein